MFGDDEAIERDVKSGAVSLFEWNGSLLTVIEKRGPEMVICCCIGKGVALHLSEFYQMARRNHCDAILFHTRRRGLARIGRKYRPVAIGKDCHNQTIYKIEVR
jgi:hypothetical protein